MPNHIDVLTDNLGIERWQAWIVADRMAILGEGFPADPRKDDTYCCSAHELETAFACCIEAVLEHQANERGDFLSLEDRIVEQLAKYFHAEWALAYTLHNRQLATPWEGISNEARETFRQQARDAWKTERCAPSPYRKVREG